MEIIERLAVLESKIEQLTARLEKYDDERTWLVKLVLGIIIAAVIGIVLNQGGGA